MWKINSSHRHGVVHAVHEPGIFVEGASTFFFVFVLVFIVIEGREGVNEISSFEGDRRARGWPKRPIPIGVYGSVARFGLKGKA
jgi:hypothetical protein